MMNGAKREKDMYEDFEPSADTLFFKVDRSHDLVSFHGRNYNIKKRLTADERKKLIADGTFFRLDANCYVNTKKIRGMETGAIIFDDTTKRIPCPRKKQQKLLDMLTGTRE